MTFEGRLRQTQFITRNILFQDLLENEKGFSSQHPGSELAYFNKQIKQHNNICNICFSLGHFQGHIKGIFQVLLISLEYMVKIFLRSYLGIPYEFYKAFQ